MLSTNTFLRVGVLLSSPLLSPAIAQGGPVRLNPPFSPTAFGQVGGQISPDGHWVIFIYGSSAGCTELFAVPIEGQREPIRLGATGGQALLPAGSRWVVYERQAGIYRVPIDG